MWRAGALGSCVQTLQCGGKVNCIAVTVPDTVIAAVEQDEQQVDPHEVQVSCAAATTTPDYSRPPTTAAAAAAACCLLLLLLLLVASTPSHRSTCRSSRKRED